MIRLIKYKKIRKLRNIRDMILSCNDSDTIKEIITNISGFSYLNIIHSWTTRVTVIINDKTYTTSAIFDYKCFHKIILEYYFYKIKKV